jgi:hypothetical protein
MRLPGEPISSLVYIVMPYILPSSTVSSRSFAMDAKRRISEISVGGASDFQRGK